MLFDARKMVKFFSFLIGIGAQAVFAANEANFRSFLANQGYHSLLTLTIGPDFVNQGRPEYLTLYPSYQNYYTNSHGNSTVFDGGGMLGFERTVSDKWSLQLGASGYGNSQIKAQGDIWQFGLPIFNNLAYSYQIQHARVMAEGKFLTQFSKAPLWRPYVSWQLGTAFNIAKSYQEVANPDRTPMATPFSNHTQTSFAWGVGVGADYLWKEHVRLGVGYQFLDLGAASLGSTTAAATNQTLSFPHLYTNQLRFQLTYLISRPH